VQRPCRTLLKSAKGRPDLDASCVYRKIYGVGRRRRSRVGSDGDCAACSIIVRPF
jgi:hypothetical protein